MLLFETHLGISAKRKPRVDGRFSDACWTHKGNEWQMNIILMQWGETAVLSLAQDIIHVSSNIRKQTPKSLSLGMAVRQITGSYALTKILFGFGNSVSHPAALSFDTALASQCLYNDIVIPKGIIPTKFTMMVWDNIDLLDETPTHG
jgi:hypothetical protein